jgi:hypothetical protein
MTTPVITAPSSVIDFSTYKPPGVYVNPVPGPQLAVASSLPTAVGLFGMSVGYRQYIESLVINPDTNSTTPAINRTLSNQGIHTSTIKVTNPNSGAQYALGTDYTVVNVGGTTGTSNALYTISRVIDGGHITQGSTVQVSYQFTNPAYFNPTLFYTYRDIVTAYGVPYNLTTGAIQSELTLAAQFAILNGAYRLVCAAVNPVTPGAPTVGDYNNALANLANNGLVAIVVCCNGSMQPIQQLVQEHVDQQSRFRFERRAILGMDGTGTPVPSTQRINNAMELSDQRVMLLSPASFTYFSTEINQTVTVGGQYMAASLAGMATNMSWAQPLTHKLPTGWIDVPEVEPESQKDLETENGLCVIEKTRRLQIWVRHGVTTDNIDMEHREWSIIGQQDAMVYRLRDYLENANLIGQPIYDYTLVNVKSSAEAALQSLIRDGLLVDYYGLEARQLLTNPDVIEVSYSWLPAFPLNYIVVTFNISLTSGNLTQQGSTANIANTTNSSVSRTAGLITAPASSSITDFGGPANTLQSTV